ncbi:hypothetical protein ACIQMR_35330 [Streptomyces sp. NPDC091376]|uniref:hypothetical protein n=1 Tax=Streptomyces sp. NPDC091376 TaxID=3365994 RepID=UPI00380D8C76
MENVHAHPRVHSSTWVGDLMDAVSPELEVRDSEIARLKDLLRVENKRADDAIRRETVAEEHAEELTAKVVERDGLLERAGELYLMFKRLREEEADRADRYRLAWLSARRRAADESNFGLEALELKNAEIRRLKAQLDALRKSTDGAPRLECMGTEEDGSTVWRLANGSDVALPTIRRGLEY